MDRMPRPFWPGRNPLSLALAVVLLAALAALVASVARDGDAAAAPSLPLTLAPAPHGAVATELQGATPVPSMSTDTSRTLRRPDGTYVTRVFASAPSFRDAHGTERLIDQTLRPVLGGYQPAATPIPTTFPATLAQPIAIDRDGTPFSMQLVGATGRATTSGSTITYKNALRGTDVSYTVSTEALGEALRLTGPDAPSRFAFDVRSAAGVTAARQPNGTIAFHRADGSDLIALAPSFATADAVQGHHEQPVSTDVAVSGDGFRVTLSVDPAWLRGQLTHGSVTIDPTMELQGTARDCPLSSDAPATSFCGNSGLWVGYNGDHDHHSLAKWDLSAIPVDSEVLWGDFGLYQVNPGPANPKQLTMSPLTRDWTSGASWSTYDGTHAWTTPGGDADAPVATVSLPGHQSGWVDWYATQLVQDWLTGARANYGVVFADAPGPRVVGEEDFLSSEGSQSPATKPELDITWTPRLGVNDQSTFNGQPLDDSTGIAVNVANGNVFLQTRGMQVPGTGLDLNEQEYHNSLGSPDELQGVGIKGTSSLGRDVKLKVFDPTTIAFYRGDGVMASFTAPVTSGTTTTYDTPPDLLDDTLTRDTSTGRYTLHAPGGLPAWPDTDVTLIFDPAGKLLSLGDGAGHAITLSYYSDGGSDIPQIHGIRDTNNVNYTVTRSDIGDGYLGDVADPSGHHWHYTYGHDDGDYLVTYAGSGGRTWSYGYDTSHRLSTVTTPDGNVTLIRYDGTSARAAAIVRTTDAAHTTGPTTSYAYSAPTAPCDAAGGDIGKTTVTPPTGTAITYCYDNTDQVTYDSSQPFDPAGSEPISDDSTLTDDPLGAGLDYDCDPATGDCTAGDSSSSAPAGFGPMAIPAGSQLWGVSDNNFGDGSAFNPFQPVGSARINAWGLSVNYVRLVIPYDIAMLGRDATFRANVAGWLTRAKTATGSSLHVLASFERCRGDARDVNGATITVAGRTVPCSSYEPTIAEYTDGVSKFRDFVNALGVTVQDYTAWNEPNRQTYQPTATVAPTGTVPTMANSGAFTAAKYYLTLRGLCGSACHVAAGDFLDTDMQNNAYGTQYLAQYAAGMAPGTSRRPVRPYAWAFHPYSDGDATEAAIERRTALKFTRLRKFLDATASTNGSAGSPDVWISEVGAYRFLYNQDGVRKKRHSELCQARIAAAETTAPDLSSRIKRFYYYEMRGTPGGTDSGLLRSNNSQRPAFRVYEARTRNGYSYAPQGTCTASDHRP